MINLTKSAGKNIPAILSRVEQLPEPANLFSGATGPLTCLPNEVLLFVRKRQLQSEPRVHHRFVLIISLREPGEIVLDGQVFRIDEHQGILIFPHQSHHFTLFENPGRTRWLLVTFEYDAPEELISLRYTPFTLDGRGWELVDSTLAAFRRWIVGQGKEPVEVNLWLALLLTELLQRQSRYIKEAGGRREASGPNKAILELLCRHIHDNIDGDLRIETVARKVSVSASHLRARFRMAMGMSLGEFIRRTRVHKACGLLHSSESNITEIAGLCGFESLYSFSRTFKNKTGESPLAFRRRVRELSSRSG